MKDLIEERDHERHRAIRAMHLYDEGDHAELFNHGWSAALAIVEGRLKAMEELEALRNVVCCAESDVTVKHVRELFELPDYSSEVRAAITPTEEPRNA